MEQIMSKTERVTVDSGTHAGIHVPVGDFRSILMTAMSCLRDQQRYQR
jgi:hypothetical protein